MKLDPTTYTLFSPFFREVSKKRLVVRNIKEFIRYVEKANGKEDVFTSVYSLDFTIDKIFLDFDGATAIEDAKKVYKYLIDRDFSVIPVASGIKGVHLYILLKPARYEPEVGRKLLFNATYSLLCKIFHTTDFSDLSIDTHLVGNIRALCRVPNTLRPPYNRSYCTYLPPEEFLDFTWEDLILHTKRIHLYDYEITRLYSLEDLSDSVEIEYKVPEDINRDVLKLNPKNPKELLRRVLRPCLYNKIVQKDPPHEVRVATTVDLFHAGFSADTIFKIYEKLGWEDWNPQITAYQIEHCRYLHPYSCKRLRSLGIPEVCCIR